MLLKRASRTVMAENAEMVTVQPDWIEDLANVLDRIAQGEKPALPDLPDALAGALARLYGSMDSRDQVSLERSVGFSMHASDAMASVSRATGDIRDVDQQAQSMSSAIEELNASIQQISNFTGTAANNLSDCVQATSHGLEQVSSSAHQMESIESAYASIVGRVEQLEAASAQITNIVDTISAIAGQTNLLALNATIEAARAGEAGRGFSVVAEEVKALSGQTEKATGDIRSKIDNLQGEVTGIIDAVHGSMTAIQDGKSASDDAAESVRSGVDLVQSSSNLVSEIARLMSEQTGAAQELSRGVNGVATASRRATDRAEAVIEAVAASEKIVNDSFADLETRDVRDYVLHRAKSDHFLWKKNLSEKFVGRNAIQACDLADHHDCRLGKWYDAVQDPAFIGDPLFQRLIEPHAEFHRQGKLAAELHERGEREAAERAAEAMEAASADVIGLLEALIEKRRLV